MTVTKDVPAGARVVGAVPNLPGVHRTDEVGTPIMVTKKAKASHQGFIPAAQIIGDGVDYIAKGVRSMNATNQNTFQQRA